jgi:hypothetical protein
MLYRAKSDRDIRVKGCKIIGKAIPLGYERTEVFFVDNSGFGGEGIALDFEQFLSKVKAGYYYGISDAGQFQVYISEFKKIAKPRAEIYKEQGILNSKLISKSCRVINYINGNKTIKLYATDIVQFKGNKIILNSGGYKTTTTKARINQFLPKDLKVYQKNWEWLISDERNYGDILAFYDGIELSA